MLAVLIVSFLRLYVMLAVPCNGLFFHWFGMTKIKVKKYKKKKSEIARL